MLVDSVALEELFGVKHPNAYGFLHGGGFFGFVF